MITARILAALMAFAQNYIDHAAATIGIICHYMSCGI